MLIILILLRLELDWSEKGNSHAELAKFSAFFIQIILLPQPHYSIKLSII
jgi:hypothetical protein